MAIQAWSGWSRWKEILKGKGNVSNMQVVGESEARPKVDRPLLIQREQKETGVAGESDELKLGEGARARP